MRCFSAPFSQIIMDALSDKIDAMEKELADAVRDKTIVVGSDAWTAAKNDLAELRKKENLLLQAQQGEKDQFPEHSAEPVLSAAYILLLFFSLCFLQSLAILRSHPTSHLEPDMNIGSRIPIT